MGCLTRTIPPRSEYILALEDMVLLKSHLDETLQPYQGSLFELWRTCAPYFEIHS